MNKFDNEQVNRFPSQVKELNESTRKLDGNGVLLQPHQARLRRGTPVRSSLLFPSHGGVAWLNRTRLR